MVYAASSRDRGWDLEKKSGSDDSVPTECLRHRAPAEAPAEAPVEMWLMLNRGWCLIAGLIAHQAADKPLLSTRLTKKIYDTNTLAPCRLASPTQTASLVKIEATLPPPGNGLPACGLAGAVCGPAGALCGGRVCGPWWPRLFSHVRANFDSSTPDTVTLSGSHNCRPISHHRQSWSFVLFASASSRPSRPFPARAASVGSRPTLASPTHAHRSQTPLREAILNRNHGSVPALPCRTAAPGFRADNSSVQRPRRSNSSRPCPWGTF